MRGFMNKILTIDDEEIIRFTISGFLEEFGYNVLQASNGLDGIEIFEKENPDLVLLDLKMPNMDGIDVIKKIKEISEDTPIVVISGINSLIEALEAINHGACDFLTKPISNLNILTHVIEKNLEKSELLKENKKYKKFLEDEVLQRTFELQQRTTELEKTNKELESEIKERIVIEKQMQQTLKDKELLIKEVHHRVKNNLQVISSILNLQINALKDDFSKDIFIKTQSRIKAMILVHEKLYTNSNNGNLESIDFKDYARRLVYNLQSIFGYKNNINISCEDGNFVPLNIEIAIPIGLIINEVVTNSIKYAFTDKNENNEIFIKYKLVDNYLDITLGDNGKGLENDIDIENNPSLGLKLIKRLASQLDGTFDMEHENGLVFNLKFPITVKSRI